jgi:biopolymer transport protein ExbB
MGMIVQLSHALMGAGSRWVLWVLVGMSALSLSVIVDRALALLGQRRDLGGLIGGVEQLLRAGDLSGAQQLLRRASGSAARVALAGLAVWGAGPEAVREAMGAATGLERARLQRGLLILGTVGNNAPFVGLLGTVIGVVRAFEELGKAGAAAAGAASQLAPEQVMRSIAEAMVATALGLLVAIPAVAAFNYFQGALAAALEGADILGHVLLARATGAGGSRDEA